MEGVDVVRQAAEEAALDLDQQTLHELVSELPDYETEVLEEGEIPFGPGEYPPGIPHSPPSSVTLPHPLSPSPPVRGVNIVSLFAMDQLIETLETPHVVDPPAPPSPKKRPQRKRGQNTSKHPLSVKDYVTLNSFLRKLPAEHKRYKLPIVRGMTMTSYLRRLGQKLGWTQVPLDHLLWH